MKTALLVGASAIALAGGAALATSLWVDWLAEKDVFFTKIPEGSTKAIMRNDTFDHFIMSFEGWHLNDPRQRFFDPNFPRWEVVEDIEGVDYHVEDAFTHWVGVRFMGLNPYLRTLKYQFVWNQGVIREDGKPGFKKRDEMTDFAFIKDYGYIIILPGAETCEGVQVDLQYQLVVRITNPYKALFGGYDWLQMVTNAANRCAKSYVGSRTFKQLQSETDPEDAGHESGDIDPDKFSCPIVKLTNDIPDDTPSMKARDRGLSGRYGVTIISANPQRIELAGALKAENEKATTAEFLAEKLAFATRTKADADAYAMEAEGTAKAKVIEMTGNAEANSLKARLGALKDAGTLGELMLQTDAMIANGEGKTIIWANNPFVSKQPELLSMFEQLGITPDKLKNILTSIMREKEHEKI